MKRLALLFLLAACFAVSNFAQDITGTIEGTVLDASGAAVPKAKVTVTNTDRNQAIRTLTTDASGTYSAVLLPVGNYSVKVEAAGFKTQVKAGIALNVNDVLKINMTMQVGDVTETVEVAASAAAVELSSGASEGTIDGSQVRELSLATRNYEQLVALMPGVSNQTAVDELFVGTTGASGTTATVPYAVNGMRNSANNYTLDGADNVDRGSNQTLGSFPSIDSIAEFKVGRSSYTADQGRAGGAQVSVITKSGTSHYHGDLFEFFRNDALNANNWANNANKVSLVDRVNPQTPCTTANYQDCYAKQSPYRWNDFGGTFGGPVPLGSYNREKNKTFFFYSEEARRIINYTTYSPTLPTQGMLQGNFPQPVCITSLASTGITCPTGSAPVTSIPSSMFNPNAVAYIKDIFSKVPLSSVNSLAGITAGIFPERILLNYREELIKIDQRFNDKFAIFGKFSNDAIPTVEPGGLFSCSTFPGGCVTHTNSPGRNYVFHAQNTITPTMLNEAGFAFTQSAILSTPEGLTAKSNNPDINPKEPFANSQGVVPNLTFTSGTTLAGYGPYTDYNRNYAFFDNVTWIKGRHTVRAGYSLNRYNKTENAAGQQGVFGFTNAGVPTGTNNFFQSWANFLLGNVSTFSQPSTDITPYIISWQHEAFAQDDFKVNPRLTVYYGVRWSYFGQPTDSNGELTNFDPALYTRPSNLTVDPTTGNFVNPQPTTQANLQKFLTSNMGLILAGGNSPFGGKIAPDSYHNFAPRLGIAWDPTGEGRTAIRAGWGVYYDSGLFGTYEQNIFANPPFVQSSTYSNASFSDITGGTATATINAPLGLHATQLPAHVPYSMQFNFTIEHNFGHSTLASVGYVGSKGTHLLGIVDINEAYPGAGVAAGLLPAGTTIFTSSTDPRLNAVRPYYGWNYINALETAFDSNYHSLQATVRKDFHSGGNLYATYTYSKNLTDNGSDRSNAPQNSYNWHEGEYGPYPGDRTHIFNLSYWYTVPIFKNSHGVVRQAFAGWQVSGILSTYTGVPLTVTTSGVDPAGLGNLGSSAASGRPDMVCSNPNSGAPHLYAATTQAQAGALNWFSPSCFASVPQGVVRPGDAGRGTVRGPGFFNLDASLMKNFYLSETASRYLQFRFESFNTFNWVNPNGLSTNITSTTFGEVTSFRAPRRVQLALKLYF